MDQSYTRERREHNKDRTPISEILYEMDMLTYLHQNGARVSTPIKRRDGMFVHGLYAPEGIRYMVLFSFYPFLAGYLKRDLLQITAVIVLRRS